MTGGNVARESDARKGGADTGFHAAETGDDPERDVRKRSIPRPLTSPSASNGPGRFFPVSSRRLSEHDGVANVSPT
jgi:hypothetical protein